MTKLYIKKNMSVSKDPENSIAEVDFEEDKSEKSMIVANGLRYVKDEVEL